MQTYVKHYERNTKGKDYVVGDIHGWFSKLGESLDAMGFDPEVDRLFSVGDLVDRGPESEKVLEWLDKPWFHPVRGNHDDFTLRNARIEPMRHVHNGGFWIQRMEPKDRQPYVDAIAKLPLAIEVETADGLVGIVHADPIVSDWSRMEEFLQQNRKNREGVMWSRTRAETGKDTIVQNVERVFVGHTPALEPYVLGNVHHIDTYGWMHGFSFTIVNISSN